MHYSSSSKSLRLARVNKGSHSFTCHLHVYSHMESARWSAQNTDKFSSRDVPFKSFCRYVSWILRTPMRRKTFFGRGCPGHWTLRANSWTVQANPGRFVYLCQALSTEENIHWERRPLIYWNWTSLKCRRMHTPFLGEHFFKFFYVAVHYTQYTI